MKTTTLGKIKDVYFGIQDASLGLHLTFLSGAYGVSISDAYWDYEQVKSSEYTRWTEESRNAYMVSLLKRLSEYFQQAKVNKVEDLKNIPVELTFEGPLLVDWRILTEVL